MTGAIWHAGKQDYWNGLPFPSPGDLPDPMIEPRSPELQADSFTTVPLREGPNPRACEYVTLHAKGILQM